MGIALGVIGFLILWVAGGLWYFLANMGYKNKPEPWWAKVLMAPLLPIAAIMGYFSQRHRNNRRKNGNS